MKRFRFSLLSLLVGVVLAGGVGGLNVRPSIFASGKYQLVMGDTHLYGWPLVAYRGIAWPEGLQLNSDVAADREVLNYILSLPADGWSWPALAANIAIGLAIVFGGAGACEWRVRRRAAKAKE